MTSRHAVRADLPIESQVKLIHADLDGFDVTIEKRLDGLEQKMDRIMVVFITGMISLIVALVAALGTALSLS